MGDRCYDHKARSCRRCEDEGRVLPKLQQLMAEPSPFASGGSLTEAEVAALEVADRSPLLSVQSTVERIVADRVQAERERLAARFREESDRASVRELADPNAYLRRCVWDRAERIARGEGR